MHQTASVHFPMRKKDELEIFLQHLARRSTFHQNFISEKDQKFKKAFEKTAAIQEEMQLCGRRYLLVEYI